MRIFFSLFVVAAALTFAGSAYGAYWFYQGYLPTGSGARTVLVNQDVAAPVYIRESWSPCTHNMKFIVVSNGGGWLGGTFYYSSGCDQSVMDQYPNLNADYGCQNPDGLSTVWVNCRAGTGP